MVVQTTGLYSIAVLKWNGFEEANQIWVDFKSHFAELYDICLQSGGRTTSMYHGMTNAYETADDDSVGSITQPRQNAHREQCECTIYPWHHVRNYSRHIGPMGSIGGHPTATGDVHEANTQFSPQAPAPPPGFMPLKYATPPPTTTIQVPTYQQPVDQ